MNINVEPRELSDEALVVFLAELHALTRDEIHWSNCALVDTVREEACAELARRIFGPSLLACLGSE